MDRDSAAEAAGTTPEERVLIARYWRLNVAIVVVLLAIWAFAGLGCGVLFADSLNEYRVGGFRLGFWFAQQGSILIFVLLILAYALILNRLDAWLARGLAACTSSGAGDAASQTGKGESP